MSITVLVVDDQAMVRQAFGALLAAQPDINVIGEAADGVEAVAEVARLHPDVVLMDVRMPEMDGLEATRRDLAAPRPRPHVLVLTTFDLDEYVYEALRAGASGFLLKDAPGRGAGPARCASSRAATRCWRPASPGAYRRRRAAPRRRAAGRRRAGRADRTRARGPELVAAGLSNAEIAERLYVSEQTVKTHVSRMLAKLDLRDRAQAVVFAYENGVVTPGS